MVTKNAAAAAPPLIGLSSVDETDSAPHVDLWYVTLRPSVLSGYDIG